jgi:hypothetical protein
MCHIWRTGEMAGNQEERERLGDTDVDGEYHIRMDLKSDVKVWTEKIWLNTGTSSGLFGQSS